MDLRAAGLLTRGWIRGARAWWSATAMVAATVLVVALLVVGLFAGTHAETEDRVAAFFTGDLRVTPGNPGAAPQDTWGTPNATPLAQVTATLESAGGSATHASPRFETESVLSRRSLLEAYLFEDDQYPIGVPGSSLENKNFHALAVLSGIAINETQATRPVQQHLVAGTMPLPDSQRPDRDNPRRPVHLLMSLDRFRDFLSNDELANFNTWPPNQEQMMEIRFEITAARIDPTSEIRDVIRFPARVVGLFETDLEALDTFTLTTDIGDARRLHGYAPNEPVANALRIDTPNPGAVADAATEQGWQTENAASFGKRYAGELFGLLESLSVFLSSLFFALPLFLLWQGIAQQLDKQRREVAVCRAIGIRRGTIATAILATAAIVLAAAAILTAIFMGIALAILEPMAQGWAGSPLPLAFDVTGRAVATTALAVTLSTVAALLVTIRSHARQNLAQALRVA